jgi:hypothetical protein
LESYQNPIAWDVLELQMRLAVREATDLSFVPEAARYLALRDKRPEGVAGPSTHERPSTQ